MLGLNKEQSSLIDPQKCLTHITPEKGTGNKGVAEMILEFLKEVNQLDNAKVTGGDRTTNANTGWKDGSIHQVEVGLDCTPMS